MSDRLTDSQLINAAVLVRLYDALRPLADPESVKTVAMDVLGDHLGIHRAVYIEVMADGDTFELNTHFVRGVRPFAGQMKFSDFGTLLGSDFAAGMTVVLHDVKNDPTINEEQQAAFASLQVGALVAVPLVKHWRLVAGLGIHYAVARTWTAAEIALIEEFGQRTWDAVGRARAEASLRRVHEQREELLAAATAARAEAEAANRAKDDFLATLSHELRTPLTAILLWARALRSGAVPLTDAARAIDAIAQCAESQSQLVEDLLDMSRLISGKVSLSRTAVDIASIAGGASEAVKPLAIAKKLTFSAHVAPDLGVALLDGERLKQIMWNLLSNAIKFTPEGGAVSLRVDKRDGTLVIEITDNGAGISPEFMPHVFQRFRQADMGETRQHMGLGIGLALSRQLVELHDGTIVAESDGAGRGARFVVRIPWRDASRETQAIRRTPRAMAESLGSLRGLHVLLVEDDADTREAMRWMLSRAGADVNAVATADEALSSLQGNNSQVIVSDLGLPGVSGFELVQRVAQLYDELGEPPPPSCAVSAHARDVDRQRAIDAGFDIYLAKPVTPERLIEAAKDLRDILAAKRD
jgi:signal transduction histidine kinase